MANQARADSNEFDGLAQKIKRFGKDLGFDALAITDTDLARYEAHLQAWLARGAQGEMGYMRRNVEKRLNPAELEPGTARVISARMNYLSDAAEPVSVLADSSKAYVARYALGRDYHKVLRKATRTTRATCANRSPRPRQLSRLHRFGTRA